jgi:hypothetical protein
MPVRNPTVKKLTSMEPGTGILIVDDKCSMDPRYIRLRGNSRCLQGRLSKRPQKQLEAVATRPGGESTKLFERFDLSGRYAPDLLD